MRYFCPTLDKNTPYVLIWVVHRNNDTQKSRRFSEAVLALLSDLPERSQQIAKKRFGIDEEKPQTLEKIGRDFGITRERVRQIVADVLRKISGKESDPHFREAEEAVIFAIEANSGIIKESEAVEKLSLGDKKEANSLLFIKECSGKIRLTSEEGIRPSWYLEEESAAKAQKAGMAIKDILKKAGKPLFDGELSQKVSAADPSFSEKEIAHFAGVTEGVEKNKFGKWGLNSWAEINPKGTREKIYSVLKEKGKPLHFTEIARLIDEYGLSKKKAHTQTVHNELIKNEKFVLVGRGIYALREWGYSKGTIRDILEEILRKSKRSLSREEILKEVLRMRQVKKATILINLSNSKVFQRHNDLYSIKERQRR
jgi:DNA-directed RNA polymerase delta subunit